MLNYISWHLCEKGADLQIRTNQDAITFEANDTAVMNLLLNEDLEINLEDLFGSTPIAIAARIRNNSKVEFLLNQTGIPGIGSIVCGCFDIEGLNGCEPSNCQ